MFISPLHQYSITFIHKDGGKGDIKRGPAVSYARHDFFGFSPALFVWLVSKGGRLTPSGCCPRLFRESFRFCCPLCSRRSFFLSYRPAADAPTAALLLCVLALAVPADVMIVFEAMNVNVSRTVEIYYTLEIDPVGVSRRRTPAVNQRVLFFGGLSSI